MIVDETLLRAYVDGELDPAACEQVEAVLARDADMQEVVKALRASCLPYRAAFEAQVLPEPPASLLERVAALTAAAAGATPQAPRTPVIARRRALGVGVAMAASFVAGLAVPWRWIHPASPGPADHAPWVRAIAVSQALYVRATVEAQSDSPSRLAGLLDGFSENHKALIFVPDLRPAGLEYKRVQRLGFGDAPLIQMAYLPQRGLPCALCVLPVRVSDEPVQAQRLEGLAVAAWVRDGLARVLVTGFELADTLGVARRLAAGGFARV